MIKIDADWASIFHKCQIICLILISFIEVSQKCHKNDIDNLPLRTTSLVSKVADKWPKKQQNYLCIAVIADLLQVIKNIFFFYFFKIYDCWHFLVCLKETCDCSPSCRKRCKRGAQGWLMPRIQRFEKCNHKITLSFFTQN